MNSVFQLWMAGSAVALFLCVMAQLPSVAYLRWWLCASAFGFVVSIFDWISNGSPIVAALALICVCSQMACIACGFSRELRSFRRAWYILAGCLVFGFVLIVVFRNSVHVQITSVRSVVAASILCIVLICFWRRGSRKHLARILISALLLLGIVREMIGLLLHLWYPFLPPSWLDPVTSRIIGSGATTIALIFMALDDLTLRVKAEHSSFERMRQLVDLTDHAVCEVSDSGFITFMNRRAIELLGVDAEESSKAWIQERLEADEDAASQRAVSDFILRPTVKYSRQTGRLLRNHLPPVPVEWSSRPILEDGIPVAATVSLNDVSAQDAAHRFLVHRAEILELIARNKPVEEAAKLIVSAVDERLPGYACSILVCDIECFHVIASPRIPEGFHVAMNAMPCNRIFQATERNGSVELHNWEDALRRIGGEHHFSGTWAEPMISSANELLGTVVLSHPVMSPLDAMQSSLLSEAARLGSLAVEHRSGYERLLHQGYHDALTGLPNRLLLADRLKQALARAERNKNLVAYLSIDLDRFKDINDTLGHDAGDLFLKQISVRLASRVRATDTLARTGGDEFTLVLPDIHDVHDASKVAESLTHSLRDPFKVENHTVYGSASIGMSTYPKDGKDIDTLQRNADRAMYRAKAQGRNIYESYSDEDSIQDRDRIEIEFHLRRAIEQGGFSLHFQPQFTCDSRLVAFEALLRFQHPKLGIVPPSRFIPMAEDSGLILPIGEWVLNEVCRQISEWQEKGLRGIRVAINVSPLQLARGDFAKSVSRAIQASKIRPDLLELELTEGILMTSVRDSAQQIAELAGTGVRLSVDDFGTGYSCLSYLHKLPLNMLKIDRSFVARMLEPDGTRCIVEAIISLAHRLGLQTVAEGVELEDQLVLLRSLGCDLIQGFYFARPLSAIDASALLWKDTIMIKHH